MLRINAYSAFIFENLRTEIRLNSRSTSFKWFLKFIVEFSLIFVVCGGLFEILFQLWFIEIEVLIYFVHFTLCFVHLVALDLNDNFRYIFKVILILINFFIFRFIQFFSCWNSVNLTFGLIFSIFFIEMALKLLLISQLFLQKWTFLCEPCLDTFVN